MQRNPRANLTGTCRLPESITEGIVLQTFIPEPGVKNDEVAHGPPSPRQRSRSWAEGSIMHPPCQLFPALGSSAGHDSTDSKISYYESLPKIYRRSNRHLGNLNTQLLLAVKCGNILEVERLLEAGASPNATCHTEYISACHVAALHDNEILSLLLKHGAERAQPDRLGRTPLHLAACAGNLQPLLDLLGLPQELQNRLKNEEFSTELEKEIRDFCVKTNVKDMLEVRCHLGDIDVVVPKSWRDNIDHCCKEIELPFLHPGWSALHAGAASGRARCCRVLLAAGAELCVRDLVGRTPLDVAGSACLLGPLIKQRVGWAVINTEFTEVIKLLLTKSCKRASFKKTIMLDTPLHTAVELENCEAVTLLLQAGVSPRNMNRAGLTPMHLCVKKQLKQLLQIFLYFDAIDDTFKSTDIVNAVDKDGNTVLHYAVLNNWLAGVCVCLGAGANIIQPANSRETPLHTAAALGNLDILKEITKSTTTIDVLDPRGETALFKAIFNGHTECVKALLQEGASIQIVLPRQYNVFHIAAKVGHVDILKVLLDHDYMFTREKVNAVTADDRKGFGPIHFAIENNHIECIKLLLSKNAFISLKTASGVHKHSTPLHIAARKNNLEIAKLIVKFDGTTIHNVDAMGWTPLHTASYYACRDVIRYLIHEGADLSACTTGPQKYQKTVIEIMIQNLSKPTEFLESIFDMFIQRPSKISQSLHGELSFQDPDTEVLVDYNILLPKSDTQHPDGKLTVIEAILRTGNRFGQRKLLIHPLVESYLCLRWKALLPFFYVMLFMYGMFVLTLTLFVMTEYGYKDSMIKKPAVRDSTYWSYYTPILYTTIAMVMLQEVIFLSASIKHYVHQKETWVKLGSIVLALILPHLLGDGPSPPLDTVDWTRHVATMVILLCWLDMTLLLSRFPKWGYYVLMFGKVCVNVVKILLTFAFLVIGFALSFMIQFHHETSFNSFWAALVKTMVMMTSEFDYDDLVDKTDDNAPQHHSLAIIRLVFLIFLIFGAIVLMNLLVGVAVHDLHNLEVLGHIMRLEKQVEFLSSLETLVLKKIITKLLPAKWVYNLKFSINLSRIYLRPCEPSWSYYKTIPSRVRNAIFEKAVTQKKNDDHQVGLESIKKQLREIHEAVNGLHNRDDLEKSTSKSQGKIRHSLHQSDVPYRLTDTDMIVVRMKRQVDDLNAKVDVMIDMMMMNGKNSLNRKSQ